MTVDVLGNDAGLEDGGLSVAITRAPAHGTASVGSDRRITYTPTWVRHPDYAVLRAGFESAVRQLCECAGRRERHTGVRILAV